MSFPVLDGTVDSNEYLCFNCFDLDRKKPHYHILIKNGDNILA